MFVHLVCLDIKKKSMKIFSAICSYSPKLQNCPFICFGVWQNSTHVERSLCIYNLSDCISFSFFVKLLFQRSRMDFQAQNFDTILRSFVASQIDTNQNTDIKHCSLIKQDAFFSAARHHLTCITMYIFSLCFTWKQKFKSWIPLVTWSMLF